jgi:SWI/SNF-related matrix-associated actin-dependent regulator of chromatin subfamily A-like protein 1
MIITSKYPGKCNKCGGGISPGDRVSWVKGERGVDHAACSDEGKAIAAKVEDSRAKDADIDVPAPEGLSYLPYQRAGIAFAANHPGVLIADEMGLGKTIQAIGAINGDATVNSVLVISPKSLTLNWVRELNKWLVPGERGAFNVTRAAAAPAGGSIVVVSYEEAKKHEATLSARNSDGAGWDLLVVDESHLIKNQKAQRTVTVHALAKGCRRRILLTGTPIANRPVELFSLLQVVAPETWDPAGNDYKTGEPYPAGSGKGFFRFAKRYCNAHKKPAGRRMVWDFGGSSNLDELQEKLRVTCMVRRLKTDVLTELPPKRRQIVEIPANGGTEAVETENRSFSAFEDEIETAQVAVELAKAEGADAYAAACAKLEQATKVAFTAISRDRHATAVAKIPHVVDHVRLALEDNDGKIVVMAHHHDVIDGIVEGLAEFGAVKLTGRDELEDRQAAVDRFQKDPTCRVFVGSIMAAGVGITLTAASHVVFAELDWTPGNVSQAEDRCHRIGQVNSVLVQHLVFDGSLDARMVKILVSKQAVADAALDKMPEPVAPVAAAVKASSPRRDKIEALALKLTAEKIAEIHSALRALAGMCDGARELDGSGFNKLDTRIGHELAGRATLSAKQAALGYMIANKYHRQVGRIEIEAAAAAA